MIPSFFVLTFLLSSCGVKMAEGVERFAVKECYKLDKKEKMVGIDSVVSAKYEPIYELGKHQIPLNRAFKNQKYSTYIGLALNSKADNLYQDHLESKNIDLIENTEEKKNYHLLFTSGENLVYRIIYTEPVQNITVVLNFVSQDKPLITSFYNNRKDFLNEKLNCGK